ncbi:uncharacterized protein EV420DRAFT_1544872, partial [Desarmillaria tabescens]
MNDLPSDYTSLVGVWCSSVLYGTLVLYFSCVNLLIKRRWWFLLGCATFQFIVSTIHITAGLRSLIEGFIWLKDPEGSIAYWDNQTRWVNVMQEAAAITNCIACDAIMIWRLYVVWNKSVKVSVLPVLCGYTSIYLDSSLDLQPESIQVLYRWLQASYSLSLATQLSTTTLIAARIWWVSRRTRSWRASTAAKSYMDIIWMIVESGAISAITSTLFLAFFNTLGSISIIIGDSLGQISAIAPSLIIYRVGLDAQVKIDNNVPLPNLHPRRALHVTVESS